MTAADEKRICLFGPQGSGKGTQAEHLSEYFGIPQIAPGNMFRQAIAAGSPLGKEAAVYINQGHLVPDDVTNRMIQERLQQEDALAGFVLDGFPRNAVQADALDGITSLSHLILITIPDEESIRRISSRRVCTNCGMTYHLDFKPPVNLDVCDECGGAVVQRDDDTPESIRKRLEIYHRETEPLCDRYKPRGIFYIIDGQGSIEDVWQQVKEIVTSC